MNLVLLLIVVPLMIALNGFFVAAEYALVRSRIDRLEQLEQEGRKRASLAKHQIERIDEYIAACQVGITLASIGIGAVGEPVLAHYLDKWFDNVLAHGAAIAIAAIIAYLVISAQPHHLRRAVAQDLHGREPGDGRDARGAAARVLEHRLQAGVGRAIGRGAGDPPARSAFASEGLGEETTTSEDLKFLIARSAIGGTLDPGEAVMLRGVFHLHEQEARNVMTPIPAVVTVDVSETAETALKRCVQSGHTRLVVTEDENTDRIRGIVHANSLARLLMTRGGDASIEPVVKDVPIVPETKPLDDLLADLQRERTSVAVVVDEYGRTAGIVSVEDIIEEVVGEITDETDPAGGAVRRLANGDWYVRGHVPITDLADYGLDLPIDSEAYNSVGGYVFGELGRLPKRGDMVHANGYSLRVESVRENRIEAVRIRDHEPARRGAETNGESVRDEG